MSEENNERNRRAARVEALKDALPMLIARGELYADESERRRKAGRPQPTPEDTQKSHDVLFLRGSAQLRVAKQALDYSGYRPDIYDGLAKSLEDTEASEARHAEGDLPVVLSYVAQGMEGIDGRRAVVDSLQVMQADAQLEVAKRQAASGLLSILGVELQQT